jgi:adenosylcobinamide kinase/adenosylcobinamide-phosphate guanylyltransferase
MAEITVITGGVRSGKSLYAQRLAKSVSANPVYLATARRWDDDFGQRIKHHQDQRSQHWQTIEEQKQISKLHLDGKTIMLDCITLWLTNIFTDNQFDIVKSLTEAKTEWDSFIKKKFTLIVVSNELGMGVHPEHEVSGKFADL